MTDIIWTLPDGRIATVDKLKLTELGNIQVKFKVDEEGDVSYINYSLGQINHLLAKEKIYELPVQHKNI